MTDKPDPRSAPAAVPSEPDTVPPPEQQTTPPHTEATPLPSAQESLRAGKALEHLPAQFGRYRLEKLLGKGGMGAVYLAHDTQLDRRVALKVPRFGPDDDAGCERFLREARAAATLHHPNLCPVFDVGELDGVYYLTMAFIDGHPLSAYIRNDKFLPPTQAAWLVQTLALALQDAHDQGIIHRDLKPANIMIGRKKQPVVMDFGLARREASGDERLTHSGAIMGTPAYMPPEQVNGDVAAMGPCCDIYSLGVILYELLTGRRPFDGPIGTLMARILTETPTPPSQLRPELDPALDAICLRALAKRPQNRYPSMREFAADLEAWQAGTPVNLATATHRPDDEPIVAELDVPSVPTPTSSPRKRATLAPKKSKTRNQKPARITHGQRWFLLVCLVLLITCVLPLAGVAVMIYSAVSGLTQVASSAGQWIDKVQQEQKAIFEEMKLEREIWERIAVDWQPPPDADPARLFRPAFVRHRLVKHDDQASVPELEIDTAGKRAIYVGSDGEVQLCVYQVSREEKEAILRTVQDYVTMQTAPSGLPVNVPKLHGSPEGTFLTYNLGANAEASTQHGTFWWNRGWLFLARGRDGQDTDRFLQDYLRTIGSEMKSTAPMSP